MGLQESSLPRVLVTELERLGATYDPSKAVPETWPTPAGERTLPASIRELARVKFPNSLLGARPTFPQDAGRDLGLKLQPLYAFELDDHSDPLVTLGSGNGDDYYRLSLADAEGMPLEALPVYKHLRGSSQGPRGRHDYERLSECFHIDLLGFFKALSPWPKDSV